MNRQKPERLRDVDSPLSSGSHTSDSRRAVGLHFKIHPSALIFDQLIFTSQAVVWAPRVCVCARGSLCVRFCTRFILSTRILRIEVEPDLSLFDR